VDRSRACERREGGAEKGMGLGAVAGEVTGLWASNGFDSGSVTRVRPVRENLIDNYVPVNTEPKTIQKK
jgi:hypothetical protein